MTGEEFLEWPGRTMTPAISVVVGFAFQTVPQDRVEALVLTYLEAVKERAVDLAPLSDAALGRKECNEIAPCLSTATRT